MGDLEYGLLNMGADLLSVKDTVLYLLSVFPDSICFSPGREFALILKTLEARYGLT